MTDASYHYVYGIVAASDATTFDVDPDGSESEGEGNDLKLENGAVRGASKIYPVTHGRLAALASPIDVTDPEQTDEDAKRHDEVLRALMTSDGGRTIVPMRFGMVFESERALKNVLRGGRSAFRRTLHEIDGRVELGVKLVTEPEATVGEDDVESLVADELDPLAVEQVDNGRFSDRLLLNRSYLVERSDREAFDSAIGSLEESLEDVIVQYSGPFAPYNFVDIQIGAQR
ncbi:GvpL/GvpF family gas vesicle protein [Natronosalvus vescus]|uniref:GvpL/GvpF family gas vesicle protein n=1 Tax=Natronosalvus vescus TaxID=2953881 RepID=UPI0020908D9E|nr:GvpL/GvpF family gas vesicle protein [Natronosalvus vescus]